MLQENLIVFTNKLTNAVVKICVNMNSFSRLCDIFL